MTEYYLTMRTKEKALPQFVMRVNSEKELLSKFRIGVEKLKDNQDV